LASKIRIPQYHSNISSKTKTWVTRWVRLGTLGVIGKFPTP